MGSGLSPALSRPARAQRVCEYGREAVARWMLLSPHPSLFLPFSPTAIHFCLTRHNKIFLYIPAPVSFWGRDVCFRHAQNSRAPAARAGHRKRNSFLQTG